MVLCHHRSQRDVLESTSMHDLKTDPRESRHIIAFKSPSLELVEKTDAMAAAEGLTRASFVRRAWLIDLKRRGRVQSEDAA
jgi:hypothetical protein